MKSDAPDNPVYEAALTCVETALQKDNRHGTPKRKRIALATLFIVTVVIVVGNIVSSSVNSYLSYESVMDFFMPNITEYIKI